ncbi:hypothetical protein [Pseudomonas soli]|uniref:hypothetical protein n=1 Tax=Pseudomonas soli TaxID=1306993 RepID=UPI00345CD7D0
MSETLKSSSNKISGFWAFIVFVAVCCGALTVLVYRIKFNGGLSSMSADWSSFGSYVGGVLGPIVSFLTLLAVIKTVALQRELLDSQRTEFAKMDVHQQAASTAQHQQLLAAKAELDATRAQAYLATQLQFLETLRAHYKREADGLGDVIVRLIDTNGFNAAAQIAAEEPLSKKQIAEQKIADLIGLSLELTLKEYSTIEEIKKACAPKLLKIMYGDQIVEIPSPQKQ